MKHRKTVIVGNWKMNTDVQSGINLAKQILDLSNNITNVEKIICPPFVSLTSIAKVLKGSSIQLGAQNVNPNENGAFTGEVSTAMLHGLVSHVVIGHSERRMFNDESSDEIAAKAVSLSKAGMTAILCVGEDLSIRKSGKAVNFIAKQLEASLKGFSNWNSLIIAYEPIWAIGKNNRAANIYYCNESMHYIKKNISKKVEKVSILYGGSVNEKNYSEFIKSKFIDGIFIGRAALKVNNFLKICKEASKI